MSGDQNYDALADADQVDYGEGFVNTDDVQHDEYTSVLDTSNNSFKALFKCTNRALEYGNYDADGKYIQVDPESKKIVCNIESMVNSEMINSKDDPPFLLLGDEKDITKELRPDGDRRLYTLPIGIGWATGSRSTLIYLQDVIVEYHDPNKNSRALKDIKGDDDRGTPYDHFMRIGIPSETKEWMHASAAQGGLMLGNGPKETADPPAIDPKTGEASLKGCYSWTTANVPKNHIPKIKLKLKGQAQQELSTAGALRSIMEKIKTGAMCNAVFKVTAKRTVDFDGVSVHRIIGFNLMSLELRGVTKRQSTSPDTFKGFAGTGKEASDELSSLLTGRQSDAASSSSAPSQAAARQMQARKLAAASAQASAASASTKTAAASGRL